MPLKINGTLNGKDFYEFKGSVSEALRFLLQRMDAVEKNARIAAEIGVKIREDISALKVKAGIWGLIGGSIPIVIGLGIWVLRRLIQ